MDNHIERFLETIFSSKSLFLTIRMNIESLLELLIVPHDPYLYMPPRHHPPVTGKTLTKIMHGNCVVKLPTRLTPLFEMKKLQRIVRIE